MMTWMKTVYPTPLSTVSNPRSSASKASGTISREDGVRTPEIYRQEIRVICLYPTIAAGKLARQWLETAIRQTTPDTYPSIEFFNFAVLDHGGISWSHVMERIPPDVILLVGDGKQTLGPGMRQSLRELIAHGGTRRSPLVIFRALETEPSLNSRILLDYVSALSHHHHCELRAMNGLGGRIESYRNPVRLLTGRRLHE